MAGLPSSPVRSHPVLPEPVVSPLGHSHPGHSHLGHARVWADVTLMQLPQVAQELHQLLGPAPVLLLEGEMGAGKTTLAAHLCRAYGVQGPVASPTFGLVHEYAGTHGPVYHFDFYRIRSEEEAFALGLDYYFESGHPCFIEWPERIPNLLPARAVRLAMAIAPGATRCLTLHPAP